MKIISRTLLLSCLFVAFAGNVCWGGQIEMKFKKGIWPNTYYLIVDNTASDRAVEFRGGWEKNGEETNYYVSSKSEDKYYFSSPLFKEIGIKGVLWIPPGESMKIPFKIPEHIIKSAEHVVFKGYSFVLLRNNGFADQKDYKELVITYDVDGKRFEAVTIDKPVDFGAETYFPRNDSNKMTDTKSRSLIDQAKFGGPFEAIDASHFGRAK